MAIQLYRKGMGMEQLTLQAPTLLDLFSNLDNYLEKLPDKTNIFYTVNQSGKDRKDFQACTSLYFDIDKCDAARWTEYRALVQGLTGATEANITAISSGHGLHFVMELTPNQHWTDSGLYTRKRLQYNAIVQQLQQQLEVCGLPGKVDPAVFDKARILRLPGTVNKKDGMPACDCSLLVIQTELVDLSMEVLSGIRVETGGASRNKKTPHSEALPGVGGDIQWYGANDEDFIQDNCAAILCARKTPERLDEPMWYAIDSIAGRFKNGRELIHEWSKSHPNYSQEAVDAKITQALEASGPRTCEHIEGLWSGCSSCKFYKKVKSPIQLKGPDFISTASTGFHVLSVGLNGQPKQTPCFEDMLKQFKKEYSGEYVALAESKGVLTWRKTHFEPLTDTQVESFAFTRFKPRSSKLGEEFRKQVYMSENIKQVKWFRDTTEGLLNLTNGVYDLRRGIMEKHTPDRGFKSVLGFGYDPLAKCVEFDKFMTDITCGDRGLEEAILEFMAYAMAGERCTAEKILVLTGEGSNGKTTLLEILRSIFQAAMVDFKPADFSNPFNLVRLDGAMVCLIEETPSYRDKDFWEMMKKISSGGTVSASEKFKPGYQFENRAKIIMTCNTMPGGTDPSLGYYRRLLIIPLNAEFLGAAKDEQLRDRIIATEMPGVLNRLIATYKRLSINKFRIETPPASAVALAEYQLEHDHVAAWAESTLRPAKPGEFIPGAVPGAPVWLQATPKEKYPFIAIDEAFALYLEWCKRHNIAQGAVGNSAAFGKRLKQFFKRTPEVVFTRTFVRGSQVRCIVGILPVFYGRQQ